MTQLLRALVLCALVLLSFAFGEDDWAHCPSYCRCKWKSGKKYADCSNSSLTVVPPLSSEIQVLELSGNPIAELPKETFENARINNLHHLLMRDCSMQELHQDALSGLSILTELYLERNSIRILHASTFRTNVKIRIIVLNNNLIERLEDHTFKDLDYLQRVEIRNNRLKRIGSSAFVNTPVLKSLALDGNQLTHIKIETLNKLDKLVSLNLEKNPWTCDCHMRTFREWYMDRNLYTQPTTCAEPPRLRGKLWPDLPLEQFACIVKILEPRQGTAADVSVGSSITLSCRASGEPLPEMKWVRDTRVVLPHNQHGERYRLSEGVADTSSRWLNLTIRDARTQDRGEFRCSATNAAGIVEVDMQLLVGGGGGRGGAGGISGSSGGSVDDLLLIATCVAIAVLALLALGLLLGCFLYRKRTQRDTKCEPLNINGDSVMLEGSVIPEMEKSLLNASTVFVKTPRRGDPANDTKTTEVTEMSRTLLDGDSVFAGSADEESRSLDFTEPIRTQHARDTLDSEYGRHDDRTHHRPDLLPAFPARAPQLSPAGSSISGAPQSPSGSYQQQQGQYRFRTLPHSHSHARSQSPFTGTVINVPPRHGYVTIPRRPAAQKWSVSSAPPTSTASAKDDLEPVYDNLGLRTTADGSSVLSLNKLAASSPAPHTAGGTMRSRPLPLPPHYAPLSDEANRSQPEGAAPLRAPTDVEINAIRAETSVPVPHRPTGKVGPKVPPKPSKMLLRAESTPLYEDECEDGTEV